MPSRDEVIETLNWTTERLSNRVWSVSLGVLATSFAYIVESSRSDGEPFLEPSEVAGPAAVALLSLLADLLQYYVAQRQELRLLRRMKAEGVETMPYPRDLHYRLRTIFYHVKIALTVIAVAWLVALSAIRVGALL
ncbi:MAG: hypothetical protein AAFR47_18220 [Pseudomonadota bacterium]